MRLHVARLPDVTGIGILLGTAHVGAVLFDRRSAHTSWPSLHARLHAIAPGARLLLIRDDDDDQGTLAELAEATMWPDDEEAALRLVNGAG